MQASVETIKQHIDSKDNILGCIRCSLEVFIYRFTDRPGIFAATENKLIFCADSVLVYEQQQSIRKLPNKKKPPLAG